MKSTKLMISMEIMEFTKSSIHQIHGIYQIHHIKNNGHPNEAMIPDCLFMIRYCIISRNRHPSIAIEKGFNECLIDFIDFE